MFEVRAGMREDSRAEQSQQPDSFHNKRQAGPTLSHRYTPQNNQQPLDNCFLPDGHYNNNSYNGFPSFQVVNHTGCNTRQGCCRSLWFCLRYI